MSERYRSIVDVHVILPRDGAILLLERRGAYGDGMLHLPSGHLEAKESILCGGAREAGEEVGVSVDPGDLRLVAVVHHRQSSDHARIGMFLLAEHWSGNPVLAEPDKASALLWCDPRRLPARTIDYPAEGVRAWLAGDSFRAHGWPQDLAASPAS